MIVVTKKKTPCQESPEHWLACRPADTDPTWSDWADVALADFWRGHEALEFTAADGVHIRYCMWEQPHPSPWLVIVPGRVEAYVKYQELALEWAAQGYSIAMIDHRGQGYSDRLTPRYEQGHVNKFTDYVDDLAQWMAVLAPRIAEQPAYLLAHSMGSAVSALYLAQYQQESAPYPFRAAVLCAPMMGINMGAWPPRLGRALAQVGAWVNRQLSKNKPAYFLGMKDYTRTAFVENDLTHSAARYDFFTHLYQEDPYIRVGGPTWQWLSEALQATEALAKVAEKIQLPVLVLQAEQDAIVTAPAQTAFAARLSHPNSRLVNIAGAYHEILMETDSIRQPALTLIQNFLGSEQTA